MIDRRTLRNSDGRILGDEVEDQFFTGEDTEEVKFFPGIPVALNHTTNSNGTFGFGVIQNTGTVDKFSELGNMGVKRVKRKNFGRATSPPYGLSGMAYHPVPLFGTAFGSQFNTFGTMIPQVPFFPSTYPPIQSRFGRTVENTIPTLTSKNGKKREIGQCCPKKHVKEVDGAAPKKEKQSNQNDVPYDALGGLLKGDFEREERWIPLKKRRILCGGNLVGMGIGARKRFIFPAQSAKRRKLMDSKFLFQMAPHGRGPRRDIKMAKKKPQTLQFDPGGMYTQAPTHHRGARMKMKGRKRKKFKKTDASEKTSASSPSSPTNSTTTVLVRPQRKKGAMFTKLFPPTMCSHPYWYHLKVISNIEDLEFELTRGCGVSLVVDQLKIRDTKLSRLYRVQFSGVKDRARPSSSPAYGGDPKGDATPSSSSLASSSMGGVKLIVKDAMTGGVVFTSNAFEIYSRKREAETKHWNQFCLNSTATVGGKKKKKKSPKRKRAPSSKAKKKRKYRK